MRAYPGRILLVCFLVCVALLGGQSESQANWLGKLLKEAGEAGVDGGATVSKIGVGALEDAAAVVRRLPKTGQGQLTFAAHATPAGHWKFSNRDGDVFTAANREEMGRVAKALAPDADGSGAFNLYLSDETVFTRPQLIDDLPKSAQLNLALGNQSFRLHRKGSGARGRLFAQVRANVLVRIGERAEFMEAVWQLGRKLPSEKIRVLSLKPGGAADLSPRVRTDKASGLPLADEIDPTRLADAFSSIRGQTALLTGRVEGDLLYVLPSSGAEQAVSLSGLRTAAANADVNFVVLNSSRPLQPGGQNWLWQTIELDGLKTALGKSNFGDFLEALAGRRGQLVVSTSPQEANRIVLQAVPDNASSDLVGSVGQWVGDAVSEVAGNVVTESVSAFMTSKERQKELDERIVPGIPSDWQFYYIAALIMGLVGIAVSKAWWDRIWPMEQRAEYRGWFGYAAARAIRWSVFGFVFLPLVGPIALLSAFALKLFGWLMVPVRLFQRILGFRGA